MLRSGAFSILVGDADAGQRLDLLVSIRIADCSRSLAADLIRQGKILVEGVLRKPGYRVRIGEEITGNIPPPVPLEFPPQAIDLDILFEDDHLIIINKTPGMVVHPAPGHSSGTLVNGLLHHCPELEGIGGKLRPGIVHRLDKDTSGVMVVAKTASAHIHLAHQFKSRHVKKEYLALVHGEMAPDSGSITLPIGRHPVDRKRMSTASRKARAAETRWRVKQRFGGLTWLELELKTGRTHQIRVHCAAIGHPIVGDHVYAGRRTAKNIAGDRFLIWIQSVKRQMLHAWRLSFTHPAADRVLAFEAPLPADMLELLDHLQECKTGA